MRADDATDATARGARGFWGETAFAACAHAAIALLGGRVFRPAFDDEIYTLDLLEKVAGALALLKAFASAYDVHPPLSYLAFYLLHASGAGEAGLRALSLAMSTGAVAIAHRLLLRLDVSGQGHAGASSAERLIALLLLATTPLLVSQGDAIRWYPMYGLVFMATLYFHVRERAAGRAAIASSAAAGVLVSVNFLGVFVYPLLAADRMVSGRFRLRREIGQGALCLAFALPGLATLAGSLHGAPTDYMASQFVGSRPITAAAMTAIGFLGGHSLGIVQSIALVPLGAFAAFVLARGLGDRQTRVLAFQFAALVAMVALGFAKPRSFAYLALALSVLFAHHFLARRTARTALVAVALVTAFGALANLRGNDTPFKRNTVVPFEEIRAFVAANTGAGDVVILSDPVAYWNLRNSGPACVSLYLLNADCAPGTARRLVLIEGHSAPGEPRAAYLDARSALVAKRRELARAYFGVDEEFALKRRMQPELGRFVLEGTIYGSAQTD